MICLLALLTAGRGVGLACTRRFSFHEFYNFLPFDFFLENLFFTHDIYPHPHPRPTTSTHYPRPTTCSYTQIFSKSIRSLLLNLCFAITIICCLHSSAICLWQTVKSIDMTQEQYIPVKQTSRNSQYFTKDLESGTVFLHLLQTCQAFLSLRTKC